MRCYYPFFCIDSGFRFLNAIPSIDTSIDYIIRTVVIELQFKPVDIDGLFLDRIDYKGLLYWYDCAMEIIKHRKEANKKRR